MRRKHLNPLKQRHDNSCGQTCVAMLAMLPDAEEVIEYMGKGRTNTRKIRKGLRKFGLKSAKRLERFRRNGDYHSYKELDVDAVLKLVDPKIHRPGTYHWVVWDSKRRKRLDPQRPRYKVPPAKITAFLRVWR
jgi:hypothetical protein